VKFAPALAVALFPLLAFATTSAASTATTGGPAITAATSALTLTVGPGDGLSVKGSDIECVVSTSAPRAVVCGIGGKSLRAKSFAFTVADRGTAIFTASGSDEQVVARYLNPAVPGPDFANASHKPTNYVLGKNGRVIVGGTHIACEGLPATKQSSQTFACGAYDTAKPSSGYYVAGTYSVAINAQYVGISKVGKLGAQTLVADENEP
jgi:hypothetical protein